MKKSSLFVIALLFTCLSFPVSGAFAQVKEKTPVYDQELANPKAAPDERIDGIYAGKYGETSLPIDSHVWFLLLAGVAVGCKVLLNKNKSAATQKI